MNVYNFYLVMIFSSNLNVEIQWKLMDVTHHSHLPLMLAIEIELMMDQEIVPITKDPQEVKISLSEEKENRLRDVQVRWCRMVKQLVVYKAMYICTCPTHTLFFLFRFFLCHSHIHSHDQLIFIYILRRVMNIYIYTLHLR